MCQVEYYQLSLLVVIGFSAFAEAKPIERSTDLQVSHIINQVPEDERADFLRYHLSHAYDLFQAEINPETYPTIKISDEDALLLLKYYLTNHQVTDEQQVKKARQTVCFPSGCIDIGDSGIFPKKIVK